MAESVPLDNRSELLPSTTSAMGSDWVYSNKYEFPYGTGLKFSQSLSLDINKNELCLG